MSKSNKPIFLEIPGFGLSNRIRTVLAFQYIASKRNTDLYVYWLVNHMCPEHYNNLFEPLPHTKFIKSQSEFRKLRKMHAGGIYFKGQGQFHSIVNRYLPTKLTGSLKPVGFSLDAYRRAYSKLHPLPEIQQQIDTLDVKDCYGLHIRRTDHVSFIKRRTGTYTDDAHFEKIIRNHPDRRFYLSTDNVATQRKFLNKFPNQIVVYQAIPDTSDVRKTTVAHAVIDLFLLGNCKKVYGSIGSSFSEFAHRLNLVL